MFRSQMIKHNFVWYSYSTYSLIIHFDFLMFHINWSTIIEQQLNTFNHSLQFNMLTQSLLIFLYYSLSEGCHPSLAPAPLVTGEYCYYLNIHQCLSSLSVQWHMLLVPDSRVLSSNNKSTTTAEWCWLGDSAEQETIR